MAITEMELHRGNGALALRSAEMPDVLPDDKIDLLKRTICEGATDLELELFVAQCRRSGLDPFARQIHAVKRWNGEAKRETMTIQVGIDGLRLIAERTGNYAPGDDTVYQYDAKGGLTKATAFVKKWVHGEWHIVAASALWSEYCQLKRDGQPMAMWGRLPHVMLEKCAEARALRKAFPQETSGLYIHEEMTQADSEAPPRAGFRPQQAPAAETPHRAPVSRPAPVRPAEPRATPQSSNAQSSNALPDADLPTCANCGRGLTAAQSTLSQRNYGEALCPTCQLSQPKPTPATAEPTEDDPFLDDAGPASLQPERS